MTIFFTFFSSLRKFSAYEAINQYEQVSASYTDAFYSSIINADDQFKTVEDVDAWNPETATPEEKTRVEGLQYDATQAGTKAALAKWEENKTKHSWLWVQNIWVQDSTTSPFPNYESLVSMAKSSGYEEYVATNINEENYNKIANIVIKNSTRSANGFYILAILAGVITFASQYITELHNKLKNKKAQIVANTAKPENAGSMKMMKIIMPAIMVIFVLTSTASFGLYILASNVAAIALGELTTLVVDKMTKKKRLEVEEFLEKEANRLIRKGQIKE
jgi:hypothetical protein